MKGSDIYQPLASLLRPASLEDFVGQRHLVAKGTLLYKLIENDNIPSMIFWGPPGVGKTSLAQLIAKKTNARFVPFSAVSSGIKDVREVMKEAQAMQQLGNRTIVFIDEIHRFNKSQQDAFLPYVENGSIILIGATTENPSFEVNSALLSRCKVFLLYGLTADDTLNLLRRGITHFAKQNEIPVDFDERLLSALARFSSGDARIALNTIEMILNSAETVDGRLVVSEELVSQCLAKKAAIYDKDGEEHYNQISALHKSMRNSDPHASIYWLTRMLDGGEDPLYIARRIIRFAAEDVGLADSNALLIANAAYQASHFIGMPECGVHLAQAVTYCALAPKSNALDAAYHAAMEDSRRLPNEPVPLVIRNAPTKLMKDLNYGRGYAYAHDLENKVANMQCLPDNLKDKKYYNPTNSGRETKFKERMEVIERLKKRGGRT